jgi:peptidoglycan/xylan/chitin deacetylase (PgdA/CDA1 family)
MHSVPRFTRRTVVVLATAALAAAGAVTVTLAATPSQAATCGGYVGLTFDDGPNPSNTNTLLSTLRSAGARATLFNIGQNARNNPSLVQAEVSAGMWIGNHSWSHQHMTQLSAAQMDSEISQAQQAIQAAGAPAPKLFRPPYGETNSTLKAEEARYGLTEIVWDVDSQDWNGASTSAIVSAAGRLTNGQIILMHDQYATTIAAIPQIVSNLAGRNLCAGMISPATGRAVAPDGTNPSSPPVSRSATSRPPTSGPPTSAPPVTGGTCQVSAIVSAWNTGLTEQITITNNGAAAINGWKLVFTLPAGQTITSGWNATYSPASGQVTASNVSYNGTIAARSSVGIGFQATHTGNTAKPGSFTLNGTACASG